MSRDKVEALRRRVTAERGRASGGRLKFSAGLRRDVLELVKASDSEVQVAALLGLGGTTVNKWARAERGRRPEASERPAAGFRSVKVVEASALDDPPPVVLRFPSGATAEVSLKHLGRLLEGRE